MVEDTFQPVPPHPLLIELGITLIRINTGEFIMGSLPHSDFHLTLWDPLIAPEHVASRERPQRTIMLNAYNISRCPITLAQYKYFCTATNRQFTGTMNLPDDAPACPISWWDAVAFCQWLSSSCQELYRLPTEAEWERAARGIDGRIYPWGDEPPTPWHCNCYPGVGYPVSVFAHPAGASECGCLDMVGNAWEWCADWYDPQIYKTDVLINPIGPSTGRSRVIRGGAWDSEPHMVRCATRCYDRAYGEPFFTCGFRIVRQ